MTDEGFGNHYITNFIIRNRAAQKATSSHTFSLPNTTGIGPHYLGYCSVFLSNWFFEYPPHNWREAISTNYFVRQSVLTFVCPWQSKAWHDRLLELGLVMLFAPKESDFSLKIVSAVSTYILSLWTWTALFLFRFLGAKRPLYYLLPSVCMYIISNMTNSSLSEYCQAAFKCR